MPKTVEEISRETGFSVTTVRFVINGQSEKYRISAKTTQQIEDYVALHGYSLNHAARSLRLNRSDTIGFVTPDLSNAFFARFMAALETRCRRQNLLLLTASSHEDPELENRVVANLLARGVDGLAIAPCQASLLPQLIKYRSKKPTVFFDRDYGTSLFPTVVSDNVQCSVDMTRKMLHEHGAPFYFLCNLAELPSIQGRIRGFRSVFHENGIPNAEKWLHLSSEETTVAGRQMMRTLIDQLNGPPPAFMCSSLLILEGALLQIRTQVGQIDPSILIGTFDDHTMLDLLPNRVLSIQQNETALADRVFERLIEAPGDLKRNSQNDVVAGQLICRNLNAPP